MSVKHSQAQNMYSVKLMPIIIVIIKVKNKKRNGLIKQQKFNVFMLCSILLIKLLSMEPKISSDKFWPGGKIIRKS